MEPQTVERRLTTILSADVVGYSRLMGEDEAGTLAALKAQRSELLDPKAAQYRGRIVKLMGDGTLMEFGSVVDAVSFAVEVQCAMAERNTEVPEARRIVYRIGINIGDVIVEGDDIYGNGVNVAARLEGLAKPGGICISRPVLEQIEGKLEIEFEYTGEHQVKNIERPIHIWRWAKDALLKDRATTAIGGPLLRLPVSHPTNLPRQLSNFVGREREISEIKQHLSRAVFLTLTGAGGCGKTRLSCQVGSQVLQDFPDGVWWVELASLADPALLRQTLATALGIRERPGRTLTDSLSEHLASKSALLILDNCEHLLAACAQLTGDLLRACPRLRILATSREALGVAGEAVYHVPGLSFPEPKETLSPDQVRRFEAVNLFVDSARLRNPEFAVTSRNAATVANVCRRLDGIPLAIELAAARTRVLSVEQIEARLGDRFMLLTGGSRTGLPQHQTLRTTMDWSYQLLSSSEAALLRRLSVFAGRFSLEAAEGVCADELVRAAEILDLLQHLIDKSMVISEDQHGAVRYRLLETVRQYGHERLDEAGECRPAMCHLEFFLALAEEAEPNLQGIGQGASQAEWLDKLALDHDNLRAALEYALAQSDAELAVKLAAALWRFWEVRGYLSEGRESLKQALAIGLSAPPSLQAKALDGAGRLSWRQGDFCDAKRLFAESLVLWRRVEDRAGEANSLHGLARAALNMNDYESARTSCEKSLEIQRTLDDKQGVATAINTLGEVARAQNDFAQAERHYSDSLEIFRAIGDTAASVSVLHNLAYTALNRNDEKKAEEMFRAAMVKARDLKDQLGIFSMLGGLACVATAMGLYERAALLFGAADIVGRAGGYAGDQVDQNEVVRHLTVARSALGAAKFEDAWARGRNMSPAEAVAYALSGQRFGA